MLPVNCRHMKRSERWFFFLQPYKPVMMSKQKDNEAQVENNWNYPLSYVTTPAVLQFCWKTWKQSQEGVYQDGVPFLSPSLIVPPQSRREEETHSFLAWRKQETHRQRWTTGFTLHMARIVFLIYHGKHTDIVQYCTHPIHHGCICVWPGFPSSQPLWERSS